MSSAISHIHTPRAASLWPFSRRKAVADTDMKKVMFEESPALEYSLAKRRDISDARV